MEQPTGHVGTHKAGLCPADAAPGQGCPCSAQGSQSTESSMALGPLCVMASMQKLITMVWIDCGFTDSCWNMPHSAFRYFGSFIRYYRDFFFLDRPGSDFCSGSLLGMMLI